MPELLEFLKMSGEKLSSQSVEVAQQAVLWGRASAVVGLLFYIVLGVILWKIRKAAKHDCDNFRPSPVKTEFVNECEKDSRASTYGLVTFVGIGYIMGFVPVLNSVMLPWIAPKLYLIQMVLNH